MFKNLTITSFVAVASLSLLAQPASPTPAPSLRPGITLPIRIDEAVSGKDAKPGTEFNGSLAVDLIEDGRAVLPAGTPIILRVSDVLRSGTRHFTPHLTVTAVAFVFTTPDNKEKRVPIMTTEISRTSNQVQQPLGKVGAVLFGHGSDYYPGTLGPGMSYQDAHFIPGDVIQLNLTAEMLLP
jgi:hypothetical protein